MTLLDFAGKVAFITGGGSGIGAETARRLGARAASVMVTDLNEDAAAKIADEIQAAGGKAQALGLNVTDYAAVENAISKTCSVFGGLDCAVNNAGIVTPRIAMADIPHDEWNRQITVNLTGVFNCMKAEIPQMLSRGGGSIVNLASILGVIAVECRGAYAAAKHGVVGLTKTAAIDYAAAGIRVNAVAPGYVDTPILHDRSTEERIEIARRHPMNRMAQPREIADGIVFLLSDASSFITGTVLNTDGGYTAR